MASLTLSLLALLLNAANVVNAVLPTAAVDVLVGNTKKYTLLASQASFGTYPEMSASNNPRWTPIRAPSDDPFLCNGSNSVKAAGGSGGGGVMLVPRGKCTFERKAIAAQKYGASGLLIYGTLASRYALNETKYDNTTAEEDRTFVYEDIIWPQNKYDYDCDKANAYVPTDKLSFDPLPYNSDVNDGVLTGSATEGNLCAQHATNDFRKCQSSRCLITGKTNKGEDDKSQMEVCCAWDLHIWLYADPSIPKDVPVVTIPVFYVTMEEGDMLLSDAAGSVEVVMYRRYRPEYNPSALLIWALGVGVCALAAFMSAGEYRDLVKQMVRRRRSDGGEGGGRMETLYDRVESPNEDGRARSRSPRGSSRKESYGAEGRGERVSMEVEQRAETPAGGALAEGSSGADAPPRLYRRGDSSMNDESLELNMWHALGFIVMASAGLLILFFLKIYNVVKVMYAFGCGGAVTQELFLPLFARLGRLFKCRGDLNKPVFTTSFGDIGPVSRLDLLSAVSGYGLSLAWLIVAFAIPHPDTNTFFWITQDVMGACMCILFLSIIKLNSIKVASVLLIVAFLYDIFFVFVTPLLFKGKSVMITVATSGGPPKADPSWCEKYPHDADCRGGDPLPMLLTIPRIGDYQGGASLLGLGDIVLPGLLLSFASRFDAAKTLVGYSSGAGSGTPMRSSTCEVGTKYGCFGRCVASLCNGGYFVPLVVAYAIGLLMANTAVYLMDMGQPALLYLVPCCLGTMCYLGWRRKELDALWHGPRVLKAADAIVYGEEEEHHHPQRGNDELEGGGGAEGGGVGQVGGGGGGGPSRGRTDSGGSGGGGDVPLLSMT